MALVRNHAADTVALASGLTGLSAAELFADRWANLRGGAVLLAHSQGRPRPASPGALGAVAGTGGHGPTVRAAAGVGGGELYAEQVADALARGFAIRTSVGERITLPARGGGG